MVTDTLHEVENLLKKGRGDLAIKLLQELLQRKDLTIDQKTKIYSKLAEAFLVLGLFDEGENILKPIIFNPANYERLEILEQLIHAFQELLEYWLGLLNISSMEKYEEFLMNLEKDESNNKEIIEALIFEIKAMIYNVKGNFNKALTYYLKAKTIFEKLGFRMVAARILEIASKIDVLTNMNSIAYELIEEAFNLLPENAAMFHKARFLATKALIQVRIGEIEKACSNLRMAVNYIAKGFTNSQSYVNIYFVASELALVKGKPYQARTYLDLSLAEGKGIRNVIHELFVFKLLLIIYFELGEYQKAITFFNVHEKILVKATSFTFLIAEIIIYAAISAIEIGDKNTIESIKNLIDLMEIKDILKQFLYLFITGVASFKEQKWDVSEKNLIEATNNAEKYGNFNLKLVSMYFLAQLFLEKAKKQEKIRNAEKALEISKQMLEIIEITGYSEFKLKALLIKVLALNLMNQIEKSKEILDNLGPEIEVSEMTADINLYNKLIAITREQISKEYDDVDTYFNIIMNLKESVSSKEEIKEIISTTVPEELIPKLKERFNKENPELLSLFEGL